MLIGLVVGALAILGALKASGTVLLAAPLAVWTIPILDSLAAIMRRRLAGRSIYTTDRGHLHHRLLELLGSNRKALGFVAVFCALTSTAALLSAYRQNDLIALLASAAVVVIFVVSGIFGRAELRLLTTRIRQFGWSLFEKSSGPQARVYQQAVRLQGTRPWESLWAMLTTNAAQIGLKEIRLDVNLPRVQEGYHAYWEFPLPGESHHVWKMELPLILHGRSMGSLMIVGEHAGESAGEEMRKLLDLLEPFENKLQALTWDPVPVPVAIAVDTQQSAIGQPEPTIELARLHPK
jgi:UDP-GlcNAc:undecaprenyl-phosphate GlcNAc-1-phosphate transferase